MKKKNYITITILVCMGIVTINLTRLNSSEQKVQDNQELALNFFQKLLQKNEDSELSLVYDVLDKIETNYVDLSKANPKAMFTNSLSYLQRLIGELYVNKNGEILLLKIGDTESKFDLKRLKNFLIHLKYNKDAYTFIKNNLTEDIKLEEIKSTLIEGLVDKLDTHSKYLRKEIFRDLKTSTTGEFGGLGIVIALKKGLLTIIAPIAGTPAAKAKIMPGDTISRIGDSSTVNMSLDEAVELMRGVKGTVVTIYIMRKTFEKPKPFTLTRDIIKIKSVEKVLLSENIGYIKIKNFQKDTTINLKRSIEALEKEARLEEAKKEDTKKTKENAPPVTLKGLIVDLRSNPGGLLDQAVEVADVFLDEGEIVSTVGLNNKILEVNEASINQSYTTVPLAMLVNEGSASASEIVAGAIKVNNRGLILGLPTFGKGTVQSLYNLDDDKALKLTIAQFLAGGRAVIQSYGITPDVQLIPTLVSENTLSLFRESFMIHEEDLDNHIKPHETKEVAREKSPYNLKYLVQVNEKEENIDDLPKSTYLEKVDKNIEKDDFNVSFTAELLRKHGDKTSLNFLSKIKEDVQKNNDSEEEKIKDALKKRDINWDDEENTKNFTAGDVDFTVSFDKKDIVAGDEIKLVARVKNKSDEILYRTFAMSESENYLFDQLEFIFGKIEPQEEKKYINKIKIPEYDISKLDTINFKLYTKDKEHILKDQLAYLKVHELPKPLFAYDYTIIDNGWGTSKGNGNGIIEVNESIDLEVHVKNVGVGNAREVLSIIKSENPDAIFLKDGRFTIGPMLPNETKKVTFNFDVKKEMSPFEFKINIIDVTLNTYLVDTLTLIDQSKNKPGAFNKTPPIISLNKNFVLLTNKESTNLTFSVKDNKKIKDIYVFVQDEKIFYQKIKEQNNFKKTDISLNLPLEIGKNEILMVARDYDNLESVKSLIIHREKKPEARVVNTSMNNNRDNERTEVYSQ